MLLWTRRPPCPRSTCPLPHGARDHGLLSLAKFPLFCLPCQAQVKHAGPQMGRKWGESRVAENLCPWSIVNLKVIYSIHTLPLNPTLPVTLLTTKRTRPLGLDAVTSFLRASTFGLFKETSSVFASPFTPTYSDSVFWNLHSSAESPESLHLPIGTWILIPQWNVPLPQRPPLGRNSYKSRDFGSHRISGVKGRSRSSSGGIFRLVAAMFGMNSPP